MDYDLLHPTYILSPAFNLSFTLNDVRLIIVLRTDYLIRTTWLCEHCHKQHKYNHAIEGT